MGKGNAGKAEGREDHVTFSSLHGADLDRGTVSSLYQENLRKEQWKESGRISEKHHQVMIYLT